MRHATVYAIEVIQGIKNTATTREAGWRFGAGNRSACTWEMVNSGDALERFDALRFVEGTQVELPTCPLCAALVDLALELRGA